MINLTKEQSEMIKQAPIKFGKEIQSIIAMEELAELTKEISKSLRGKLNEEHMAEEIADSLLMIEQLMSMHNNEDKVRFYINEKLEKRLKKLLQE